MAYIMKWYVGIVHPTKRLNGPGDNPVCSILSLDDDQEAGMAKERQSIWLGQAI
jgi:hypothetical protein